MADADPAILHIITLPALGAVGQEIAATATLGKNDAVAELKAIRSRELNNLRCQLQSNINEMTGLDVVLSVTALTDAVVQALTERAMRRVDAPRNWCEQVGIFAVGGYGRGEMNPFSDLDLLMLDLGKGQEWTKRAYAELQAMLWDVRFQVGASHRTLDDLPRLLDDDFVTATAMIESRPVVAGTEIIEGMTGVLRRFRKRNGASFLRFKLEELEKRRAVAGASLFVMEPNLKNNPGCLRDVQLLQTMAFIACGSRNILALGELDSISRDDLNQTLATQDHLLQVRSLLHFTHGRKQDVFHLADQVKVAAIFGYSDVSSLRAVEHLMKRHYVQVRHVHMVLELAASRLDAKGLLGGRFLPLIATRRKLDDDFVIIAGRIYLANPDFWKLPDAGVRIMCIFRKAQLRDLRIAIELQREIGRNLVVVDDACRRNATASSNFLSILGHTGKVGGIIREMHASGFLGAWLPEFFLITCHMQFDSWHQYTVDEHSLLALGYLDQFALGREPGLPGMERIWPAIPRKDLFGLALLIHDVGKYMGKGHVARGALMVSGIARRIGLDREAEDQVHFLVEMHVALSDASRKRDFREGSFLKPFAMRIASGARLDALYCLTWADARAVGEGVLTGWQETLLAELYETVRDQLNGVDRTPDIHCRLLEELVNGGVTQTEAERHLAAMGVTYEHQMATGEVLHHWKVLSAARIDGIGMLHELRDRHVFITLALPDRHGLFADVAATLSGHGFDIVDLRTWITESPAEMQGFVVYTMHLASIYPGRLGEAVVWDRLCTDLLTVSRGLLDAKLLLDKRRGAVRLVSTADSGFTDHAIKVDNTTSDACTILDVVTLDEVGLLSRLCRVISDFGCGIGYACINTMGDVAVDVFYVTRAGRKLTSQDAEDLRQHLITELGLTLR